MNRPVNSLKQNTATTPKTKSNGSGFGKSMANSVRLVLDGTFLSWKNFSEWISLVIFLAFLGLVYIGNNHLAEKKIRETDKINSRIKELKFDHMYRKSQLTEVTRQSYIGEQLISAGVKASVNPPNKIFLNSKTPGHDKVK